MQQGEILKNLRIQKNITQKNMADFLSITKSAYGYYEQGRNQMDYNTLIKLADYFNVTIDYLITGKSDNILVLNNLEYEHITIIRSLSELNKGQIYGFARGILLKSD